MRKVSRQPILPARTPRTISAPRRFALSVSRVLRAPLMMLLLTGGRCWAAEYEDGVVAEEWSWIPANTTILVLMWTLLGIAALWLLIWLVRKLIQGNIVERLRHYWRENALGVVTTLLLLLLITIYFSDRMFIHIYSGEAGILWSRLDEGTKINRRYGEGLHILFPWDLMYVYNMRLQESHQVYQVLSKDGLQIHVEISVRYRPVKEKLRLLHQKIGPNDVETLILPEIGAQARKLIGLKEPEELYSSSRLELEEQIKAFTREQIKVRYEHNSKEEQTVYIEDVLIREILLPVKVQDAIESKLVQRHQMLEYKYRIEKEEQEKIRKGIEAEGIRLFQDTVKEGINERYLTWKGIDATLALAQSNNSKIVVIGAGDKGLPIILGNVEYPEEPPKIETGQRTEPETTEESADRETN